MSSALQPTGTGPLPADAAAADRARVQDRGALAGTSETDAKVDTGDKFYHRFHDIPREDGTGGLGLGRTNIEVKIDGKTYRGYDAWVAVFDRAKARGYWEPQDFKDLGIDVNQWNGSTRELSCFNALGLALGGKKSGRIDINQTGEMVALLEQWSMINQCRASDYFAMDTVHIVSQQSAGPGNLNPYFLGLVTDRDNNPTFQTLMQNPQFKAAFRMADEYRKSHPGMTDKQFDQMVAMAFFAVAERSCKYYGIDIFKLEMPLKQPPEEGNQYQADPAAQKAFNALMTKMFSDKPVVDAKAWKSLHEVSYLETYEKSEGRGIDLTTCDPTMTYEEIAGLYNLDIPAEKTAYDQLIVKLGGADYVAKHAKDPIMFDILKDNVGQATTVGFSVYNAHDRLQALQELTQKKEAKKSPLVGDGVAAVPNPEPSPNGIRNGADVRQVPLPPVPDEEGEEAPE